MKSTINILYLTALLIIVLSGCVVGNTKPYSTKQLTGLLNKQYESKGRFTFVKTISKGENQRDTFMFHDKERDIDFIVESWVSSAAAPLIIPVITFEQHWRDYLNTAIIYSCRNQAMDLAISYGLKMFTVSDLSDEPVMGWVIVSKYDEILNASALFIDLTAFYKLEVNDVSIEMGVFYNRHPDTLTVANLNSQIKLVRLSAGPPGSDGYVRITELAGGTVKSDIFERSEVYMGLYHGWLEEYRKDNLYSPFKIYPNDAEDCIRQLQMNVKTSGLHNFPSIIGCFKYKQDSEWFRPLHTVNYDNDFPVDKLSDDKYLQNYWISQTKKDSDLDFTIDREKMQDIEIVKILTEKWSNAIVFARRQDLKGCAVVLTEKKWMQKDIKEVERMLREIRNPQQ
jgi:hypothetical protein